MIRFAVTLTNVMRALIRAITSIWEQNANREWKQALKRTSAWPRLKFTDLCYCSLTKHHVHARFCIVNSTPAQYMFIMP